MAVCHCSGSQAEAFHFPGQRLMAIKLKCPICNSSKFEDFNGRTNDRCSSCKAMMRTRSAWLLLMEHCRLAPGMRMAHFAPERPITERLRDLLGAGYEAYDYAPNAYPNAQALQCDLCSDLHRFAEGTYDVVMHNHVLEHLPCNYTVVAQKLHALLKPGGFHVFSVPLTGKFTCSDLSPDLTKEDRTTRFGQYDHLRQFGRKDFDRHIGMIFPGLLGYNLSKYVNEAKLRAANITPQRWSIEAGNTVFVVRA